LLLYLRLGAYESLGHGRGWWAIFHSVSAFCNAGFGLQGDSLMRYSKDPLILAPIMLLIIFGGLGHGVVLEMVRRIGRLLLRRPQQPLMWTLNSRIVLWMSGALVLFGFFVLLVLKVAGPTPKWYEAIWGALFQSVTCRTAGFNTVDMTAVPQTALLVMILLMFIGGSPASCAGGVKTTSVATWFAQLWAWLRGREDVTMLGRRLPPEIVARAAMIIGMGVVWCSMGGMILTWLEGPHEIIELEDLMFEQVSAFGTRHFHRAASCGSFCRCSSDASGR
jgi:trk system potassium uptake protein TrkH